jgi:hypothetical protein
MALQGNEQECEDMGTAAGGLIFLATKISKGGKKKILVLSN